MSHLHPIAFRGFFTLGAFLVTACGDDDGSGPEPFADAAVSSGVTSETLPSSEPTATSTGQSSALGSSSVPSTDETQDTATSDALDAGVDAQGPAVDSGFDAAISEVTSTAADTLTSVENGTATEPVDTSSYDAGTWTLSSPAFLDEAPIPPAFTCDAGDFASGAFPGLEWTGGPPGTKSYAVVFIDASIRDNNDPVTSTAAYNRAFHWAIWDIPANALSLPPSLGEDDEEFPNAVPGARQWAVRNQFGFFPPCPNSDPATVDAATLVTDRYAFYLYALNTEVFDLPEVDSDPTMFNYTRTLYDALETSSAVLGRVALHGTSDALSVAPPGPRGDTVYPSPRPSGDQ